jgi:hypothetical protein
MKPSDPTPHGDELEQHLSQRLKSLGFDPGWPVYRHDDAQWGGITVEDIRKALFESTYMEPVPIMFGLDGHVPIRILVLLVKPVWVPEVYGPAASPIDCEDDPHWYLQGVVYKNSLLPTPAVTPVHAYVGDARHEGGRETYLQVAPEPSGAQIDTPLRWGTTPPGSR